MIDSHRTLHEERLSLEKDFSEQLKAFSAEKENLLSESHHRVTNSLEVIASLLSLQACNAKNGEVASALNDSLRRVRSLVRIHNRRYWSDDHMRVDFAGYLSDVSNELLENCPADNRGIDLRIDADRAMLGVDQAIPCAQILSELIANALTHAFPGDGGGEIRVSMRFLDGARLQLTVLDDGKGMPEGLDWRHPETLGLQIVNALVGQLRGKIDLETNGGTCYTVDFPCP